MVETHHFFPYIFVLCCLKYLVWCWWLCLINTNVKIEEKFNKFLAFGCMIQVQPYTNAYRSFNSLVSVTVRICWFICFNRLHYQLSNDGHLSFNFDVLVPLLFLFFVPIRTHLRNVDNSCSAVKLFRYPLNFHFSLNMSFWIILATSHIILAQTLLLIHQSYH